MNEELIPSFFRSWLTAQGAVFEPTTDGVEALLEPPTSQLLHCHDSSHFVFSPQHPGVFVGLGTELLNSVLENVEREVPVAFARLEGFTLRGKNLDQDLGRDFTFHRCAPRRLEPVATIAPFTRMIYRLSLQSDEAREVLLQMDCFERNRRLSSGEKPFPADVEILPLEADDPRLREFIPAPDLLKEVREPLNALVEQETTSFRQTLTHRLNLDLNRLSSYYSGLMGGLAARWAKKALTHEEHENKKEAITRDFNKQIEDLRRKYGIRARMTPVAVLRILLPVLQVQVEIAVGKATIPQTLFWTPLSRTFEPFHCPSCGKHGHQISGTRDGLLFCPDCAR